MTGMPDLKYVTSKQIRDALMLEEALALYLEREARRGVHSSVKHAQEAHDATKARADTLALMLIEKGIPDL